MVLGITSRNASLACWSCAQSAARSSRLVDPSALRASQVAFSAAWIPSTWGPACESQSASPGWALALGIGPVVRENEGDYRSAAATLVDNGSGCGLRRWGSSKQVIIGLPSLRFSRSPYCSLAPRSEHPWLLEIWSGTPALQLLA